MTLPGNNSGKASKSRYPTLAERNSLRRKSTNSFARFGAVGDSNDDRGAMEGIASSGIFWENHGIHAFSSYSVESKKTVRARVRGGWIPASWSRWKPKTANQSHSR